MQNADTPVHSAAQPIDALRVALRSGKPIIPNLLALWSPPDIPDTCDGHRVVRRRGEERRVLRDWTKRELALKERFGGILLSYTAREKLKLQPVPEDAPLFAWVTYALNVIWSLYSRAVFLEGYRRPFEDYVRYALIHEERFNSGWINMVEAAQALRLSLGLPRFRPTSPSPLPPRAGRDRGRR